MEKMLKLIKNFRWNPMEILHEEFKNALNNGNAIIIYSPLFEGNDTHLYFTGLICLNHVFL